MAIPKPRGPVPDRSDKRRRANKPESQGAAETESAEAGDRPEALGFEAHPLIQSLWDVLGTSAEAKFYSAADWERVRLELLFGSTILMSGKIGAMAWATFQSALSELLISPADKRRAGIELKPKTADLDEEAAVVQIAHYQAALGSSA